MLKTLDYGAVIRNEDLYIITNRNLSTIKKSYGEMLNIPKLKGKNVLDLGCGNSSVVKELREKSVNAFSIDMADIIPANKGTHIMGFADQMPFKNAIFDLVISTWSLFSYVGKEEIKYNALKEIYRVLKPNGKILITPVDSEKLEQKIANINLPLKIHSTKPSLSIPIEETVKLLKLKA